MAEPQTDLGLTTVIIPARNEIDSIEACLDSILTQVGCRTAGHCDRQRVRGRHGGCRSCLRKARPAGRTGVQPDRIHPALAQRRSLRPLAAAGCLRVHSGFRQLDVGSPSPKATLQRTPRLRPKPTPPRAVPGGEPSGRSPEPARPSELAGPCLKFACDAQAGFGEPSWSVEGPGSTQESGQRGTTGQPTGSAVSGAYRWCSVASRQTFRPKATTTT